MQGRKEGPSPPTTRQSRGLEEEEEEASPAVLHRIVAGSRGHRGRQQDKPFVYGDLSRNPRRDLLFGDFALLPRQDSTSNVEAIEGCEQRPAYTMKEQLVEVICLSALSAGSLPIIMTKPVLRFNDD